MIYTCYEMIHDCRAGRPEGWSYFISNYIPVIRKLLDHYAPGDAEVLDRVLLALRRPDSTLFATLEPGPERWFLGDLRQRVMAQLESPVAGIELDLPAVAAALEPLTVVEKQAAWFETMRYPASDAGTMLRMAPATVEKIRAKASELIRGSVDAWRQGMLAENGAALGRAAAEASGKDCLTPKAFLDVLDGRTTWREKEDLERHVVGCWHCVDHFCRMAEVIEVVRGIQPLSDAEAEPFRRLLGVQAPKASGWKRLFGS